MNSVQIWSVRKAVAFGIIVFLSFAVRTGLTQDLVAQETPTSQLETSTESSEAIAESEAPLLEIKDASSAENIALTVDEFHWVRRLLVVLADSPFDPRFVEQLEYLERDGVYLAERDVLVLVDTNPTASSSIRKRFRPRDFVIILVGKDGNVALRKPSPWSVRELSNAIDKLPVRQQELRSR